MAYKITVTGRTFEYKASLKKDGFRWNPAIKGWTLISDNEELANNYAIALEDLGLTAMVTKVSNPDERKYFVKEGWIFNLEAMHDKLWCLENDIDEHRLSFPVMVAGKELKSYDDLEDLRTECQNLESIAKSRKVTGKEYGRIREVVSWRIEQRYMACIANGMDEAEAGKCFEDM